MDTRSIIDLIERHGGGGLDYGRRFIGCGHAHYTRCDFLSSHGSFFPHAGHLRDDWDLDGRDRRVCELLRQRQHGRMHRDITNKRFSCLFNRRAEAWCSCAAAAREKGGAAVNWWEPFQYEFLRDAMLLGSLIAVMCAVLSCFLVLRGWSLMGDAVSHALLPGIVLAYLGGIPLLIGAFLAGLLCAVATGWVKNISRLKEDTSMGVVFTGLFAVGLVLFSKVPSDLHLDHILFGNLLGIGPAEFREVMFVAFPLLLVLLLKRKDFLLLCFDAAQARVIALPAGLLHYGLLALLSLAIVVSLKAVGMILVTALLITPGATAYLVTNRFDRMLGIAACTSVISTVLGLMISFHFDASPAACIVLFQSGLFGLAWIRSSVRERNTRADSI